VDCKKGNVVVCKEKKEKKKVKKDFTEGSKVIRDFK
tara:strand:- start:38 stop:145 length:108 start_codon:yes stop_codon:yes gene_type:complete